MQNPIPIPHTITDWFWFILASFFTIGGGTGFWIWLQNRRKVKAEARELDARSRNLDVQSTVSAGDVVLRYIDRLSNAEATIIDQRRDLIECRERAAQADSLYAANALLESQLRRTKALLKLHNIRYDE